MPLKVGFVALIWEENDNKKKTIQWKSFLGHSSALDYIAQFASLIQ